jgi:hypothetical protein
LWSVLEHAGGDQDDRHPAARVRPEGRSQLMLSLASHIQGHPRSSS